ncbi:MAG: hypothetical protein JWQ27_1391 [Ferruginibacter sp.]|nr:hypothetical protein [Ferruginibacter sp.]
MAWLLPGFFIASCSDVYTICTASTAVNLSAGFYKANSFPEVKRAASNFTITNLNSNTVIYNQFANLTDFYLVLDPTRDTAKYAFRVNGISQADTISFVYQTTTKAISLECGSVKVHRLTSVYATSNTIDTIKLVNPEVTNDLAENIRIYF